MHEMHFIATPDAPKAIGPYSQAVVTGPWVFCSGQVALDPATGQLSTGDVREQTERVLKNLSGVLKAAGCRLSNVVRTTVFLKDMSHFTDMNEVYAKFFGDHRPSRSTVEVARLPKDALVEIDCFAIK